MCDCGLEEKIEAKIKELENSEDYGALQCRCGCSDYAIFVVDALKDLLPPQAKARKQEKEKPE